MHQNLLKLSSLLFALFIYYGSNGQCNITGVAASYDLCSNPGSVTLSSGVSGGYFSGPGVSGSTFSPTSAGVGSHTIDYFGYQLSTVTAPNSTVLGSGGTGISLGDDALSAALPLGFNFEFYQNTYSSVYVSSNGFISFTAGSPNGCCSGQLLPNTATPNNLIAWYWEDLDPGNGLQGAGQNLIFYRTVGSAPNRRFVLYFRLIDHFADGNNSTGYIVLYEGTNEIDIISVNLVSDGGNHTQGIENINGTNAYPVPGRNSSNWSASGSSTYRYVPCEVSTTVTVDPNNPPTITCPSTQSLALTASCSEILPNYSSLATATDDCSATITQTPAPGTVVSGVGPLTVTLRATDAQGLFSECTFTVNKVDVTPPLASCLGISVDLDATGNASITSSMIDGGSSDVCGIASLSLSTSSFTCANVGSNSVGLTVTDVGGNSSVCTATVIVNDVTPPNAVCQNISVDLDAAGNANITGAMVNNGSTDACGIASYSVSPSSFTCANVGANTVTLTVTDNNGNSSTCTATVTVNDVTPPVATCQNITVALDGAGSASITAGDINNGSTDACGIAGISVSPSTFTCANVGANTVTLTVTDVNGNSNTCTAIVTVNDTTPPIAVCQNTTVTLNATGNASITAGDIDNGSSDPCGLSSLAISPASFNCSNLGANTVTLTVTDLYGNSSNCTATVTVNQDVSSTAPSGITASSNVICLGGSTTLSVMGGSLGTGATWEWYSGSCGGTPVGSGPSIVVSPTALTTYYVRAESVCGDVFTACAGPESVLVNATTTPPASATLPTAPGTYSSTCTINDALTHYMYDSNGNLLGAINSNGENLGDVTLTIEVGNNGPYGTGFPPGVCGYTGVTDGEYALARNWDIQITGSNPPANPSTVTFYYLSSEVTDLSSTIAGLPYSADYVQCWGNVTTESDLMMTVHHTGGSTELFPSITPAAGPGAGLRELGFNLGEFSQGFLHSNGGITGANNALPVELLSWEAKAVENSYVHLSWSTATEINNAGFELLRSTDGENFEAIAWIEGNNNSTEVQDYSYNDNKVNVGTYYYQLKQVDHNGDYEYFDVLSATIKGTESTLVGDVYPNPTDRDITIAISSATDASINVQVFNYVGQEVLTQNAQIRTGNNQLKVNTNTLPEGAYYAVFQIGDELFTKKFVVAK